MTTATVAGRIFPRELTPGTTHSVSIEQMMSKLGMTSSPHARGCFTLCMAAPSRPAVSRLLQGVFMSAVLNSRYMRVVAAETSFPVRLLPDRLLGPGGY